MQEAQETLDELSQLLSADRLPLLTMMPDTGSFETASEVVRAKNVIQFDNFYQSGDDLSGSNDGGITNQTVVSLQRQQTLLGVDFSVGARMFLTDGQVDESRSGAALSFNRNDFLQQLQRDLGKDFPVPERDMLGRMSELDPDLLAAQQVTLLNEYLTLTNSPGYTALYKEATQVADSLAGYDPVEFDDRSKQLIALKQRLTQLEGYYQTVLPRVQGAAYALRQQADNVVRSAERSIDEEKERYVLAALRASDGLSGLQKLLLLSKQFSIGTTQLGDDGNTTVGLPIRGINYAFEQGVFSAEVQYGKRIASRRFVPREGIPFHDLARNFRFGRVAIGVGREERSRYEFSILDGRETTDQIVGTQAGSALPRRNRVITFTGQTRIREAFFLKSLVSYSETRLIGGSVAGDGSTLAGQTAPQLNVRAGAGFTLGSITSELAVFRTGAAYTTFANPYLYTDYQGLEASLLATNLGNRLTARFTLAGGFGTDPTTRRNVRIRAQGQLQYRINAFNSLLLVVSPNVYRYEVTGQEGLSESSIYQLSYQHTGELFGRPSYLSLGGTNLNQGLQWTDTTTTSQTVMVTGNGQLELGRYLAVGIDLLQSFAGDSSGESGRDWSYGLLATVPTKVRISSGIRYDRYRYETAPAWGGNVEVSFPLTKFATVQLNIFYRPAREAPDSPITTSQLFSQQSWQASF